jgi:gas vesicle protein
MSSRARIGIVIGAVVILVAALVIASSGGDDNDKGSSASSGNGTVTVKDAKPVDGIQKLKFTKGGTIHFTVKSDTTDEVHFHGYDVHKDVKAGGSVTFDVPATIEGRFVVELEDHKQQIAEVEVDPS